MSASVSGDVQGHPSRPASRSGGGFLERVRSSFSSSVRPTIVQSPSLQSTKSGKMASTIGRHEGERNRKYGIVIPFDTKFYERWPSTQTALDLSQGRPKSSLVLCPCPASSIDASLGQHPRRRRRQRQRRRKQGRCRPGRERRNECKTCCPQGAHVCCFHICLAQTSIRKPFAARLSIRQACSLLEQCASEIKQRGLAMVGIFRPFRLAESNRALERLIELFLLSSDPHTYQGVFALETTIPTSMFRETLGKSDPSVEFRRKLSYAHVFDVVALFKWALRRVDFGLDDFKSAQQYSWYETFVKEEKAKGYPANAFSTLLLRTVSSNTGKLLQIVFELMSTISAHHLTNAMPARRISRTLGFWLFGRVGVDHDPIKFASVYEAWERAGKVTEHLLLTFIREQASHVHLMPSRLMELVHNYPYVGPNAIAPSLPPAFTPTEQNALLVEVRSENIVLTPKQPRRTPKETFQAAVKSQNPDIEASEDLDDWFAMLALASRPQEALEVMADDADEHALGKQDLDDNSADGTDEALFFADEDVRILDVVNAQLQRHREVFDGKNVSSPQSSSALDQSTESGFGSASYDSSSSISSRRTFESAITPPSRSASFARSHGHSLATLSENGDEGQFDWSAFSSGGFSASTSQVERLEFDKTFRPKNELERAFEEQDRAEALALERKLARKTGDKGPSSEKRGPPTYVLDGVSTFHFDDTFAAVWQDQLMDECHAARLPNLLCAQLNGQMASNLLGNAASKVLNQTSNQWLIIHETVIPPRPPMPPTPASSSTFFRKRDALRKTASMRRGRTTDPTMGNELSEFGTKKSRDDDDDRQSLFSIRSGFSAHFPNAKTGVRKMRSMLLSPRKSSVSAGISSPSEVWSEDKRQAEIDAEVQELQAVVSAKREKMKQGSYGPVASTDLKSAKPKILSSSAISNTPSEKNGTDYAKQ